MVYIKWIDSVKKTYPSVDGDHAITDEKNTTLTKILWYNLYQKYQLSADKDPEGISKNSYVYNAGRRISHQYGYKSCKLITNVVQSVVNHILGCQDLFLYEYISKSEMDIVEIIDSLRTNKSFMDLLPTNSKSNFTINSYEDNDTNINISDNLQIENESNTLLFEYQDIYEFQNSKKIVVISGYFMQVFTSRNLSNAPMAVFGGVNGMWVDSVLQEIASILNDVFYMDAGKIAGIDFGHGNGISMLSLLESLNDEKFHVTGIEVSKFIYS